MQIHLSKPGGQREGPFTVEEINRDLAARKYSDNDYWAWYDGIGSWVPLHSVPGVKAPSASSFGHDTTETVQKFDEPPQAAVENGTDEAVTADPSEIGMESSEASPQPAQEQEEEPVETLEEEPLAMAAFEGQGETGESALEQTFASRHDEAEHSERQALTATAIAEKESDEDEPAELPESAPDAEEEPTTAIEEPDSLAPAAELATPTTARESKVFSGLPAEALEQIFVFTSGDGPSIRQSGVIAMMMLEMIGENPDDLRQRVPRDVFGKCNVGERIRKDGKVPAAAWRAMLALRPELVERAKAGQCRTCVRTFTTENADLVAIFLFYNKARLQSA